MVYNKPFHLIQKREIEAEQRQQQYKTKQNQNKIKIKVQNLACSMVCNVNRHHSKYRQRTTQLFTSMDGFGAEIRASIDWCWSLIIIIRQRTLVEFILYKFPLRWLGFSVIYYSQWTDEKMSVPMINEECEIRSIRIFRLWSVFVFLFVCLFICFSFFCVQMHIHMQFSFAYVLRYLVSVCQIVSYLVISIMRCEPFEIPFHCSIVYISFLLLSSYCIAWRMGWHEIHMYSRSVFDDCWIFATIWN